MSEKSDIDKIQSQLFSFYQNSESVSIKSLLLATLQNRFYQFQFNVFKFLTANPENGSLFFHNFPLFRKTAQKQLLAVQLSTLNSETKSLTLTLKQNTELKFVGIPTPSFIYFNKHPHFTPQLLTRLTILRCKIVKMSQKRVREKVQKYVCQKCSHVNFFSLEESEDTLSSNVLNCQNTKNTKAKSKYDVSKIDGRIPQTRKCGSTNLKKLEHESVFLDYNQFFVFLLDSFNVNMLLVKVTAEGDFGDTIQPGSTAMIFGHFTTHFAKFKHLTKEPHELLFSAFEIQNENHCIPKTPRHEPLTLPQSFTHEIAFRNTVLANYFNGFAWNGFAKLVLLLFVFNNLKVTRTQKRFNLLILADEKTGKTHVLNKLRSVFGLSALTNCASLKEDTNFTLEVVQEARTEYIEAGILSLANGGILLMDDLNHMPKRQLTSMEHAFRERRIVNQRFGVSCEFRIGLLCTSQPNRTKTKNKDADNSLESVTGFNQSFLDLFDLVLGITQSEQLESNIMTEYMNQIADQPSNSTQLFDLVVNNCDRCVLVGDHCRQILVRYVQVVKESGKVDSNVDVLTVLEMLSANHAKIFARDECTQFDVVSALFIYEYSMVGFLGFVDENCFLVDSEKQFRESYQQIISLLKNYK